MHRPARSALSGLASLVIAAALGVSPAAAVAGGPAAQPSAPRTTVEATADLAPALAADGTYRGAPGVTGTVSADVWTLTSDLATGEAPRFAPATAAPTPAGPAGIWAAIGSSTNDNTGTNGALNTAVYALVVSGSNLYVGGEFTNAAGILTADYIARWNGSAWSALGSNGANGALNAPVRALAVSASGDLLVGGEFGDVGGDPTGDHIAKWDGSTWSALGSNGAGDGALNWSVEALAVSGSDLYVGGAFDNAAGVATADFVAKWDGSGWSSLGSNVAGTDGALAGYVDALAVSGSDVYVGGYFENADGIPEADWVAKWDGVNWSALGSNGASDGALGSRVAALAVSGSDLYVGGFFRGAAGIPTAEYVAKWNGSTWSALGSNVAGTGGALASLYSGVTALAVSGSDLYVGGYFRDAAGIAAGDYVAKWNGSAWSALGSNVAGTDGAMTNYVQAFAVSGSDLYVGGWFANAAAIAKADYVAKWGAPPPTTRKPDGRIRLGTTGALLGNNVYNTTGAGQAATGSALRGKVITFGISVQNDGNAADSFKLKATGTATTRYTVKYYKGTTDITARVVAGTYSTGTLAAGAAVLITVKVTVKSTATAGSSVSRLVTVTSAASAVAKDAVKLVGKRK